MSIIYLEQKSSNKRSSLFNINSTYSFSVLPIIDVLIIVRQQAEAKVKLALDYMQKRVPWKTDGFSFRFYVIANIEDEGTAATLLKVAKKEMVRMHLKSRMI